ncbi:hypothetical protein IFM89_008676 [Coptis chinensis]|uniref:Uncharacterized protein n=1 Tax=Coptis chinensis TaxID=261450 RepID=A0A835GWN3_9MAGN|nr:hypothetical protein IFM89_008676 [Coptis chinensis]
MLRSLWFFSSENSEHIGFTLMLTFLPLLYFMSMVDAFNDFKDKTGSFNLCLCQDVKGMLTLYEASHLCLEGEKILYEAKEFTAKHLKLLNGNIDRSLAEEVTHSLELPLHWRMPRLESRYYIDAYQSKEGMNPVLLELAKLDFNMLQSIHQKELKICLGKNYWSTLVIGIYVWSRSYTLLVLLSIRWWKHLGLSNKLSFARDRLVEGFLWSVGLAYEPQYLCCREWITKVVCFILTLDDLYDNYGSLEELKLFTAAVERWDLAALAQLPDYMITCFLALFNTTNDIVYTKYKARGFNILPQLKKAWAEFCKAMLVEAEWSYMRYTPSLSEYLENAWVSSSTTVGLVHAFFGTEQLITNDILECLDRNSDLIYYSSMVFRLCNDLATSSAELESGDELSAIQCYMHEANTSEHVARDKIKGLISDVWKKLNKSIYDSPFKSSFVNIAINHARAAHTFYQNGDGVSVQDHEAKKRVTGLLIEAITIQNKESSESLELKYTANSN